MPTNFYIVAQEEREKKEEMFGKMGPIPSADYLKIYRETGIDVDGRGQMIKEAIETMDPVMRKLIAFYKCLPGFQSLPLDDQVTVLKGKLFKRQVFCR